MPTLRTLAFGLSVKTSPSAPNRPPSLGQQKRKGSLSRFGSSTTCCTGAKKRFFVPLFRKRLISGRCPKNFLKEKLGKSCASLTRDAPSSAGQTPSAHSILLLAPRIFTAKGKTEPLTFSKSKAGPSALTTRVTTSVISKCGSTSTLTRRKSPLDSKK